MKIGLIFSSVFSSPNLYKDKIFAPRELLTNLSNGLLKNGHEVTVFSAADFSTKAKIVPSTLEYLEFPPNYHKFRELPQTQKDILKTEFAKRNFELNTICNAFLAFKNNQVELLHVYHDSSLFISHYIEDLFDAPILYTLHDPLPPSGTYEYKELQRFSKHKYISISDSQRRSGLKLNFIDTVYHGIDIGKFPFQKKAADYLLFMGRLVPEKGLHSAITVALKTNIQLEIGTHFPDLSDESEYFKELIKPFLTDPLIGEPGMVDGDNKTLLYKDAMALLFPIEWEEPFGMVMIEAMACGTPVIAYNRGSVSEIVRDGVTGFIVEPEEVQSSKFIVHSNNPDPDWIIKKRGVEGLIEAVKRIGEIDRVNCRKHIEENFTVDKMVEGYERVYEKILITKSL